MLFLREFRHSRCLMQPMTALMLAAIIILGLITLIFQVPTFILGFLMAPLTSRGNWFVEFLYPTPIAKWGHLLLLRMGAKGRNGVKLDSDDESKAMHSRAIEQRTEVVKGRVFIHPLPQFLDNIGYLIVCVPPKSRMSTHAMSPLLGILIDCGDADSVVNQVDLIKDVHYSNVRNNNIEIHTLLSTHKHHDHTGGNKKLLKFHQIATTLKHIYGGAVDRVPECNKFATNGELVILPSAGKNDMGALIEIECVAVPSHTRGSIVYTLRNKPQDGGESCLSYLFTGDAMFSSGSGVPFEADLEFPSDGALDKKTVHSRFKPSAGLLSIERCFAEILHRSVKDEHALQSPHGLSVEQILVFPGHEYTLDLLQRQMQPSNLDANSQWSRHQPSVFFELASQFFIAGHRRNLPKSNRLLTVPSTMKREMKINPTMRCLKKRGETLLTAITVWYKYVYDSEKKRKSKFNPENSTRAFLTMPETFSEDDDLLQPAASTLSNKTISSHASWTANNEDFNRSVFTTVYSSDLEQVITQLKSNKISKSKAATHLSKLSERMENQTVTRRPIPNTLPSEKKMYLGLIALAVLGSPPSALSPSDCKAMDLPKTVTSSDHLLISKSRIISSLFRLGVFTSSDEAGEIVRMIHMLWEEARIEYVDNNVQETTDFEVQNGVDFDDTIELGFLKMTLYAVPYRQPSWFSKYCMPCNSQPPPDTLKKSMKRTGGELVKHDVTKCPLCYSVLGCPKHDTPPAYGVNDDNLSFDAYSEGLSFDTEATSTITTQSRKKTKSKQAKETKKSNHVQLIPSSPNRPHGENNIELRVVRSIQKNRVTRDS